MGGTGSCVVEPVITQIVPPSLPYAGARVTVKGANLGTGTDLTSVLLCGAGVSVVSQAIDEFVFDAPAAGSLTACQLQPFSTTFGTTSVPLNYNPSPQLLSTTPPGGPVSGGTQITIQGTNLGDGTDITAVTICGSGVTIVPPQTATSVVVHLPAVTGPARSCPVETYSATHGTATGLSLTYYPGM